MALRFITVNILRKADIDCACCKLPIATHYLRDLPTGLIYHGQWCYSSHILDTQKAIEYVETPQVTKEDFYR